MVSQSQEDERRLLDRALESRQSVLHPRHVMVQETRTLAHQAALAAGDLTAAEEHGRALVAFSEQAYSMCPHHPHLALQVLLPARSTCIYGSFLLFDPKKAHWVASTAATSY